MTKSPAWPTPRVLGALARRYPDPGYAFFTEVRNQTGFQKQERTADAIAMSLYPSRGLTLQGFEVKTSRSDWIKELRAPDKAEAIQAYCDRWWLVVGSASIVQPSELLETWGLMVPSGTGLKVKVDAPKLDPKPLDRLFVASVLRVAARASQRELDVARAEGLKAGRELETSWLKSQVSRMEQERKAFEDASGVEIVGYRAGPVGEAVKMVLGGKHLRLERLMAGLRTQAERIIKVIDGESPKKGGARGVLPSA